MKIAVVGCGALGSFYGAKLCRIGQDVHFLLRSDYDVVRQKGVTIRSIDGDFHVQPRCARTPDEIGVCDVVLIGLKTTANDQFPKVLPPLVGPHTAVVTLQNGLGNEEELARLFPPEQILGGLCFVCLNRVEPGVIQHTAHGKIVLGEFQGPSRPRTHKLAALFRQAGIACDITENLACTHWEKLVWNIPFNGLGVAGTAGYEALVSQPSTLNSQPVLTTDLLLGDPRWEQLVRELMLEVIAAANALDFDIPQSRVEEQVNRTRIMGAYKASTLIDFERGQPLELENMFLEPLRQAQTAGVPVPRLVRLCEVLHQLDPSR
ncbi:MAG TPA: 2-dehydropantoate 2-reductase [Candidatus Limnocylindrales bacterium]|nr:2-dehydropantoate 2-reductase [Candidatus Limnocylindrales bacterium]